ncbi:MAG: ribosome modulation factor [Stellaceae bacterium]
MGRRISGSDERLSTDPREIFEHHLEIIKPLKAEVDAKRADHQTANATYRSALKAAKKDGVDTDAMVQALALAEQDPDEAALTFRNLGNYLTWMNSPLGSQFRLDGEAPDAPKETRKGRGAGKPTPASPTKAGSEPFMQQTEPAYLKPNAAQLARAFADGKTLGAAGKPQDQCPYRNPANKALKDEWARGWTEGQETIAGRLAPAPVAESVH